MSADLIQSFATASAAWFAFAFGSYAALAGGAYWLFWVWGAERFAHKRIQPDARRAPEPRREFRLSALSLGMLAVMLGGIDVLTRLGFTRMYSDVAEHGQIWFWASVALMAVVHDTYYYWAHRWMHSKLLFKHVHRVHHDFSNPTPFASYAFHPLEGVIEIAIIGAMLLLLPIHPYALGVFFLFLTVLNVVSHLGFEFYPAWVSAFFITSTHHNIHHSRFKNHYMLYFDLWDRLMGTNFKDYRETCRRLAAAKADLGSGAVDAGD